MSPPAPSRRGEELAPASLLEKIRDPRHQRTIAIATRGTEELRYLDFMGVNANVGGEALTHILLRSDPRHIEVWEEFLHGTQWKCRLIEKIGLPGAERHVKDFMIRHRRLLGISEADADLLSAMIKGE